MRRLRNRFESGAALVELAIVFPIIFALAIGTVEIGFLAIDYLTVTNSAREGARTGAAAANYSDPGPPAVDADGTIYFGSHDKKLYALKSDGSKKWEYLTGGQIISSPAIGKDGTIYFSSVDGRLHAVQPDGTRRWVLETGGITPSSPVIDDDGSIYIGVNKGFWAVSPDGKKRWDGYTGAPVDATPVIPGDGTVYFASINRYLYGIQTEDGKWKFTMDCQNALVASPVLSSDGMTYILNRYHKLLGIQSTNAGTRGPWPMFRGNPKHTGRAESETAAK